MKLLPSHIFQEHHFGLSLAHAAVRAVAIDTQKKIQTAAELPLESDVFSYQTVNKIKLSQAIAQLLAKGKFISKYAAVCIPEYHSFTRSYTVPKIPLDEVNEALSWQIEKIFPLPKEEIYFDWKLLSQTETQLHLLVVAMHKHILDELISVFESVNLKPVTFEPSASALTRILNLNNSQPTVLIEINPSGSSATLVENNISTLTITNQFDRASTGDDVKEALLKTSQSIQSLVIFHANKHSGEQIPMNLLLTGDSASNELASWLSSFLNKPVSLLEIPDVPLAYQQAYAAANTSISPPQSGLSVNLLPSNLQKIYKATKVQQKLILRIQLASLANVLCLGLAVCAYLVISMLANTTLGKQKQIEINNAQYGYDAKQVAILNKNSTTIVSLFDKKNNPVEAYQEVIKSVPENVTLKGITYDAEKRRLTLVGLAQDRESLLKFKDELSTKEMLINPTLPLGSLEKPTEIEFSLIISLNTEKK